MKKNGFTLAELLGVLVLLGILGLIVFTSVDRVLKEGKEDLYQVQITNIKSALQEWAADSKNWKDLPKEGDTLTITLGQLKEIGKMDLDIKDPRTDFLFPEDMHLTITNRKNKFEYEVLTDTGTSSKKKQYSDDTPIITIPENMLEYIELEKNGIYPVKDAKATTVSGTELPKPSYTIYKEGSRVDSISKSTPGIYNISYMSQNAEITSEAIKTVIVKDTTPPDLIIPANSTIHLSQVEAFDLMNGVSATDISDYTIKMDRTLKNAEGSYTITYTATDVYGNSVSKKRIINVTP